MRLLLSLCILLLIISLNGCSGWTPARPSYPGYPLGFVERGSASWYGPGFHGNRTANGEVYDMHKLTAAHRTLPLGSVAVVRSLTTGRQVTVRINDRGPFARGRILDLSLASAQAESQAALLNQLQAQLEKMKTDARALEVKVDVADAEQVARAILWEHGGGPADHFVHLVLLGTE